jgi:hypothetical protein
MICGGIPGLVLSSTRGRPPTAGGRPARTGASCPGRWHPTGRDGRDWQALTQAQKAG